MYLVHYFIDFIRNFNIKFNINSNDWGSGDTYIKITAVGGDINVKSIEKVES